MQMDVQAGVGYGIVVDGFAGKFGTYQITVSAAQVLFMAPTALLAMPLVFYEAVENLHCTCICPVQSSTIANCPDISHCRSLQCSSGTVRHRHISRVSRNI